VLPSPNFNKLHNLKLKNLYFGQFVAPQKVKIVITTSYVLLAINRPQIWGLFYREYPMKKSLKLVSAAVLAATMGAGAAAAQAVVVNQSISEADVIAAQAAWCQALVDINATYEKDGQPAAKALAEQVIDAAYGYQMGAVLFKPTLTVAPQTFRPTRAGALAYFVGGDADFPNDTGFALKGWTACESVNNAIFITGDSATSMGNVSITGKDGAVTTVDKTWKYVKDDAGALRIVVHHSSLPYTP
jgi:hypothetical protein